MTALLVLRPDFTTTLSRGIARVAGTVAGALLAWAISLLLPATPHADVAAAIGFATAGFAVFSINWAIYSAAITGFVVFMLALIGLAEPASVAARVAATLIGGALALGTYALWPTSESRFTRAALADLRDLLRDYSMTVLAAYGGEKPVDPDDLAARQREAWKNRTQIEAAIERVLSEPERTHDMPVQQMLTVFASTQRYGLANLALTAELLGGQVQPIPAALAFAKALDIAMRAVVDAVRSGSPPTPFPDLRAAHSALIAAQASPPAVADGALAAQCASMSIA